MTSIDVSKKQMPYYVKKEAVQELLAEMDRFNIDVRRKPDYKDKHQGIAYLGQFLFWFFRNWYETTIPVVFGVCYLVGYLFGWFGLTVSAIVAGMCLVVFEVLRYFEIGKSTKTFDDFFTQIGDTIYVPSGWSKWLDHYTLKETLEQSDSFYKVIRHEMLHVFQKDKWGEAAYTAGYTFPFAFLTFRGPLIELDAYTQNMLMEVHYSDDNKVPDSEREYMAKNFSGPNYLFMFTPIPIPGIAYLVARWLIDRRADKVEAGEYRGMAPYDSEKMRIEY